jgi:hypothetical protein
MGLKGKSGTKNGRKCDGKGGGVVSWAVVTRESSLYEDNGELHDPSDFIPRNTVLIQAPEFAGDLVF